MAALFLAFLLTACQPQMSSLPPISDFNGGVAIAGPPAGPAAAAAKAEPFVPRPIYKPGELVDYTAQTGDTLPTLAMRFNTTVEEIREANSFIPDSATTMPPGMPMKIPIYYQPLWGSPHQIVPDSQFVNGPAMVPFDTEKFVSQFPGWLSGYHEYARDATRSGAGVIDYVAEKYSVSPTILLALLEYQSGALSNPDPGEDERTYPIGYHSLDRKGLYYQLVWAANTLNNGYYGWRTNRLMSIEFADGREERFDPWQNAATVALHYFFNIILSHDRYDLAVSPDGLARTYIDLFGDPWANAEAFVPGSLEQPALRLPFGTDGAWAMTGGPHTGYGKGDPLAALDFAPPSVNRGCVPSDHWVIAMADGVVVRSGDGVVVLDLDGDGDERTGWEIFYLHAASKDRAPVGMRLKAGDPLAHPSCEGGTATGTHIHIARKYNGEWLPAEGMAGVLAFNLDGWVASNGSRPYLGYLTRSGTTIVACECSNAASQLSADPH